MTLSCYILLIVTVWRYVSGQHANNTDFHGRHERSLGFNFDERRITFPPGSTLILTPTLAIPFVRNLPEGFSSDMTISAPFSMNMDDLGLADEDNPWGVIPGISQTREDPERRRRYHGHRQRFRRSPDSYQPHPLGDRKVVFAAIEDYLYSLGHNGEACLRRAICEFHEHPLPYHGLFGEAIGLLFRVSAAPFADEILEDYITAEKDGRERSVCHHYFKECPISLFSSAADEKHKYRDIDFKSLKKRRDQNRAKFQANHANRIH